MAMVVTINAAIKTIKIKIKRPVVLNNRPFTVGSDMSFFQEYPHCFQSIFYLRILLL